MGDLQITTNYKSLGEMQEVFNHAAGNGFVRTTESAKNKFPIIEVYGKDTKAYSPSIVNEIYNATDGYQQTIDTLTFLRGNIVDSIFYTENISDSVTLNSEGGWSDKLDTLKGDFVGDDLESGFFDSGNDGRPNNSKDVDALMTKISVPILNWSKGYNISISQINQSGLASGRSILSVKEKALMTQWQLIVQQVALNGLKSGKLKGVNTLSDVTIDTTTIAKELSDMTPAEIQKIVGQLLVAWAANNPSATGDGNSMPDTFRVPFSDSLGLSEQRTEYVDMTKYATLLKAFKEQTKNENFKIIGSRYNEKSIMSLFGQSYDRYSLYKKSSLLMSIPIDMMYATVPGPNFTTRTDGIGRISSVYAERPLEAIYFDNVNS